MQLGEVLSKERERKGLQRDLIAAELGLSSEEYAELEEGASEAERWGPLLARIAIALSTPTSRLLAPSGRAGDVVEDDVAGLIRARREQRGLSAAELAEQLEVSVGEVEAIEAGETALPRCGRLLLRFAEIIDQPVFNLFYPCGLPLAEIEDYP